MRKFVVILMCLALSACSPNPSTETPIPNTEAPTASPESASLSCESIVETSLESLQTSCSEVGRNEVCYGSRLISVQLREGDADTFNEPGDRIPINSVERMSLSPLDETSGELAFALMQIQADLPDTLPGQNVTFLLFGGTEIQPQGEVEGLQAFYVRTGIGATSACNAVPEDGLVIQSPEGDVKVAFSLNGVRFELGSTAYITASDTMQVRLLEGQAVLESAGESQTVSAGQESSVPLDETGQASGAPSVPQPYDESSIVRVPLNNLPRAIEQDSGGTNGNPRLNIRATATESIDLSDTPIADFGTAANPERGIVSGEIAESNEIDVYTFESTGNQAIYIDAQEMEGDIRMNITGPNGTLWINQQWLGVDYGILLLDEAGSYTAEFIGHQASTGTYQIQFWNVPAPNRLRASINPAIPDSREGLISGTITSPAARDNYTFLGEAGQKIFLDAITMEGDIRASIISPSDAILLDEHWLGIDARVITLEESGTYRLEIAGNYDSTGNYELMLWDVPLPDERTTEIASAFPNNPDGINQGDLLTPASRHSYTFTGEAGRTIFFDAQEMEGDIRATLTSPNGTVLLDQHWMGIDPAAFTLPESGDYTLEVFGNLDSTGSYQFQIWNVPSPQRASITIASDKDSEDGRMVGILLTPAASREYSFDGEAGQQIYVALIEQEGDIRATITSPDGEILLDAFWMGLDSEPISLPVTGQYTIRVHGNLDSVGSFEFQLRAVTGD
jgi:hypothetical protein